jgi:acyl carrier protein
VSASATFTDELLAWLNRRFAPARIELHTPLFAGGLINSIRILELIAWVERATGGEIPDAQIRMDNFGTPARIAQLFAGEGIGARR